LNELARYPDVGRMALRLARAFSRRRRLLRRLMVRERRERGTG
jgi:hypothetical protein